MKYTLKRCWHVLAEVIVVLAILVTVARLSLPLLDHYRPRVVQQVSQLLGQPVSIASLSARWEGMGPLLVLGQVRLLTQDRKSDLVRVDDIRISIDFWRSLVSATLILDHLDMSGAHLTLVREQDGRMGLEGLAHAKQNESASGQAFIGWFFAQGLISLSNSEVTWVNKSATRVHRQYFGAVSLSLRNDGGRHQMDGQARLSAQGRPDMRFVLDLFGDVTGNDWHGQGYLESQGLELGPWLAGQDLAGVVLASGRLEARLWSRWQQGRLQDVRGAMQVMDIDVLGQAAGMEAKTRAELKWGRVSAAVFWQRQTAGWGLSVSDLLMGPNVMPTSLQLTARQENAGPNIVAQLDRLGLPVLLDLLRLLRGFPTASVLSPGQTGVSGELRKLRFSYRDGEAPAMGLAGSFEDVRLPAGGDWPGLSHLDGHFQADESGGLLKLELKDTDLLLPALFRQAIPVGHLAAEIAWMVAPQRVDLAVTDLALINKDLKVTGDIGVTMDTDMAPTVNARLDLEVPGGVAKIPRYLPAKVMSEASVEWLDRALVKGDIPRAYVIFQGRVDQFPFVQGAGRFEAGIHVLKGVLDFSPGWPRIEKMAADVRFLGKSLKIEGIYGETLGLKITGLNAEIADLYGEDALLVLTGRAHASTQQALDYMAKSPVSHVLGRYGRAIKAIGGTALNLDLEVPLMHAIDTRVAGVLTFKDSTLSLTEADFDIDAINGELRFTEEGVFAEGIQARLLGLDSRVDVFRQDLGQGTMTTRLRARGKIRASAIRRIVGGIPEGALDGSTSWFATLDLPAAQADPSSSAVLQIHSDLVGLNIKLPPPVAKKAGQLRVFSMRMVLPQRLGRPASLRLGQQLTGLLDLDADMDMRRLALHWGQGAVRMDKVQGIQVSGHFSELALSPWLDFAHQSAYRKERTGPDLVFLDLSIDDFLVSGYHLSDVSLLGHRQKAAWQFGFKGPSLSGWIKIPHDLDHNPWQADLDHVSVIPSADAAATGRVSPLDFPAMEIKVRSLVYDGMSLGSLNLSVARVGAGLRVNRLVLEQKAANLSVKGDWIEDAGQQMSRFEALFHTQNLGGVLDGLRFSGIVNRGHGDINATLLWPGGPMDISWSNFEGQLDLSLQKGRLLEIEPGAGRVLGLLSLRALPRRIVMDFSDVLRTGYAFDRMEGDFKIASGTASTSRFFLDGPSARIDVKGTTNLVTRQYDQHVFVTPHVGAGLPVVGALAAGLGVGAVVLIFERIFHKDIDKIGRTHYRVTGSWDAPDVVIIK